MTIFGLLHILMDPGRAGSAEDVATLKRILDEIEAMEANIRDKLLREFAVTRQRRLRVRISFLRSQRLKGLRFLKDMEGEPSISGLDRPLFVAAPSDSANAGSRQKVLAGI